MTPPSREDNHAKRAIQRLVLGNLLGERDRGEDVTVVCMPGESCWDVDFFSEFAQVKKIIAIEREGKIANLIRHRTRNNPLVRVETKTTASFLADTTERIDLLYLDYCSPFSLSVQQDISIVFRRRLLDAGGKMVVNLYGRRENEETQISHRLLFEDFDSHISSGETWKEMNPDRRRRVAFNSLIARFNLNRTRRPGSREGTYTITTPPLWHSYESAFAPMFTSYFSVVGHSRKPDPEVMMEASDCWYARDKRMPRL